MNTKRKTALEIGINVLFITITIGMFIVSAEYDFVQGTLLGARTFPLFIGSLLSVFAVVNITKAIRRPATDVTESSEWENEAPSTGRFNTWLRTYRVASAIGLMVLYYLLMVFAGFIIATLLFLPMMLYVLEYRKPVKVALVSVIGVAFLYVAFKVLLGVPLPASILF